MSRYHILINMRKSFRNHRQMTSGLAQVLISSAARKVRPPLLDQERSRERQLLELVARPLEVPASLSLRLPRTEQTISQVFHHSRFSSSAVTQDLAPSLFFQIIYGAHLHQEVAKWSIDDYSTTSSLQQGIKEGRFHPRDLSILTNS